MCLHSYTKTSKKKLNWKKFVAKPDNKQPVANQIKKWNTNKEEDTKELIINELLTEPTVNNQYIEHADEKGPSVTIVSKPIPKLLDNPIKPIVPVVNDVDTVVSRKSSVASNSNG